MIPRIHFANLPTPIEFLPRLTSELGGPEIYVKRDDLTGLAFGGNKTRKLEFLLAEARSQDAGCLITAGAVQSNHCRQTAAAAAKFGLDCILVLTGDPPLQPSGNTLLDRLLGAEIEWCAHSEREKVLQQLFDQARNTGLRPYLIPYGGSSPTGASAYAFAIQELQEQKLYPDWIVFPTSSGGTQAGMVVGGSLYDYQGKILGISVDEPAGRLQARVAGLAGETARLLGHSLAISPGEILVNDDYLGGGYGIMGEYEKEAVKLFARLEGLLLDPVYTGRAAGGLVDLLRRGFFARNQRVLFWHTGGTPALFADRYSDLFADEGSRT
jgi:D-cysteine desulfhydrase family pyridoxal phosphate-dependent enzyme